MIERMSRSERLEAMELLWKALSRNPNEVPSPLWHGEVLDQRLAAIERGEAHFLTLEELKQRLNKKPA